MSFARSFSAEIQRLAPLFEAAEIADREFHEARKEAVATLSVGQYKNTERYRQTLDRFYEATQAIDRMISTALVQAKLGDSAQLPALFAYLALPGRFFRSGYQRANIWRFLKKVSLDEQQSDILRGIVLRQIETAGPEFVEICRAAARLDSSEFRQNLNTLVVRSDKHYVRRRGQRLLARLEP
jgi:hypothetical protein